MVGHARLPPNARDSRLCLLHWRPNPPELNGGTSPASTFDTIQTEGKTIVVRITDGECSHGGQAMLVPVLSQAHRRPRPRPPRTDATTRLSPADNSGQHD